MRRFLSIIGGLFLVLVLLAAGLVGYVAYQGRGLDASSKAYVEENIPAIISTWSFVSALIGDCGHRGAHINGASIYEHAQFYFDVDAGALVAVRRYYPSSKVVTPKIRSSRNDGIAPVYMRAVSNTGTSPRS